MKETLRTMNDGGPTRKGNKARRRGLLPCVAAGLALWGALALLPGGAVGFGFEGMRRDLFPVFFNPPMLSAAAAEAQGVIFPRDAVIGVSHNGEAKAYPISIMGFHELGNDTLGGKPIAVSW